MRVLLSIKPEFVEKIFAGEKKYEFRKSLFKREDVTAAVIYATSPICRVVGEFEINGVLNDDVVALWEKTKRHSGITKDYYMSYFKESKTAKAIQIGHPLRYERTRLLSDYHINQAPQSYCYICD